MKRYHLLILSIFSFSQGMAQDRQIEPNQSITGTPREMISLEGIDIPVYDFKGFKSSLEMRDDTTYVINFWATWCRPCIEELPSFQQLSNEMKGEKVKFIYVSLDFRKNLEKSLIPFIKAKGFPDNVIMLNDADANKWIDQVDPSWSGAIPATLIYKNYSKVFLEKSITYEELKAYVHSIIYNQNENN